MRPITRSFLLAAVLAGSALPAMAQWSWRDANNQVVFSDLPPPPSVKPSQILRQPGANAPVALITPPPSEPATPAGGSNPIAQPVPGAPSAAPLAAPAAPKTMADREMEFRKRTQEREAAERKAAEAEARASQLAQECQRSRGYLRSLEDGIRIVRDDGQGNRNYIDDAQRETEKQRLRDAIGRNCS
jgi:type IV secretory pathway VirB10-like protein